MEPWIVVGVVWLVCAIVCGFVAPMRGRPAGQWFWTGLFLGIFGVAALALAEPLDRATLRTCVHCGKAVDPSRKRLCDNCGEPFAA